MHYDQSVDVSWIVDTGASDHMSSQLPLFNQKRILQKPILIRLSDGNTKTVTMVGNIKIHPKIILKDVLYVKDFKYSLLSISKLLEDSDLVPFLLRKDLWYKTLLLKGLWLMAIKNQDFTS